MTCGLAWNVRPLAAVVRGVRDRWQFNTYMTNSKRRRASHVTIFALPDVARTRASAGASLLKIVATEGEWYRVEFDDSQRGRRIGYIEKRFVGPQAADRQSATSYPIQ